jgi:predicted MPP superfamily phosphohydrolase
MLRIGFLLLVLVLLISFDWYAFSGLSMIFEGHQWFTYVYWTISLIVCVGFYKVISDFRKKSRDHIRAVSTNLLMGFCFAVLFAKIFFIGLLFAQDVALLLISLLRGIQSYITDSVFVVPSRNGLLITLSALLSCIPFVSMIYGITLGKYKFEVERLTLKFPDLPKAFNGFRIVQISDIHAGSFDSLKEVRRGIEMIKAQKGDIIVFTGDLVNSLKDEINPFLEAFSHLSAPFGMYSILGNHDYYGMFQVAQKDPMKRQIYMDDFTKKHEKIGFKLLRNESLKIVKDEASIRLIGVENWGAGPFPKEGDLNKALEGVDQDEFSVLLSHDPTHWDHHVLPHLKNIHLTLSGHTHGMQFGINLTNFKWSPIKYRYKRWIGLYEQAGQFLYVNRGFGFLAWPGRVGMSPEITVLEFESTS